MHIHVRPAPFDLTAGWPLQQRLHGCHAWRILHLIFRVVLPQSLPKLLPRRSSLLSRIVVHTPPTDPEFILLAFRAILA